jgi:hypothetical protein
MNGYRDLQSGVDDNTAQFETKDYPLDVGGRVTELKFQAKSGTSPVGNIVIYYSKDEGVSWSDGYTVSVRYNPDLEWYSFPIDFSSESVRFKFLTEHDISIGELKLLVSSRTRQVNS